MSGCGSGGAGGDDTGEHASWRRLLSRREAAAECPFSAPAAAAPQAGLSRRRFLGAAVAAAGAWTVAERAGVAAAAPQVPGGAPTPALPTGSGQLPKILGLPRGVGADGRALPGSVKWRHAVGDPRGSDVVAVFGRAKEARFGTMFKDLPAFAPDDALLSSLAASMTEARDVSDDIVPDGLDNVAMPSGYVYLGQFIDHDMTRDTTPLTTRNNDPHALTNFDTPKFDLGSVYGQGPAGNPELYESDRKHLKLVTNALGVRDLPRDAKGVALIGDPRNDENLIVSQLQQAFILLHNHFLDGDAKGNFARAQQLTQWHFQWVIVHDFLPRLVGQELVDSLVVTTAGKIRAKTAFYRPGNPNKPMMPIEYSVGAYRWGHSGIRPEYEMHQSQMSPSPTVLPIFSTDPDPVNARDLRGSRPLYPDAQIDWNYFFELPGVDAPDDRNYARLIDTQVARPLLQLPDSVVAHTPDAVLALAERNLLRGKRLGLPAGQDVAARMKKTVPSLPDPLTNDELGLPDPGWSGKAPLWFYCLKEAELLGGTQLGPVAGRIVAEVILGLLQADKASYWNAATPFTPVGGAGFRMGHLVTLSGAPVVSIVETPDPLEFGAARGVITIGR
jgi:hypothetical protein